MTLTVRTFQWITGLAGLGALVLGLLDWFANMSFINVHLLFGFTMTLALLVLSILMLFIRGMRIWGAVGIVYALLIPVFGLTQAGWQGPGSGSGAPERNASRSPPQGL